MNPITSLKKQNRKDLIILQKKLHSLDALNKDKLSRLRLMERLNFTTENFKPETNRKEMLFQ